MKPYFHFLLSSHAWSSDGLPTIEELPVSQATPEKKSTDKSPSTIQDLLSGDALPVTLKHVTIQQLPLSGWKRKLCTIFFFQIESIFKLIVQGISGPLLLYKGRCSPRLYFVRAWCRLNKMSPKLCYNAYLNVNINLWGSLFKFIVVTKISPSRPHPSRVGLR